MHRLLADEYGDCIALRGRDCSVQRRFQKIVEEGPVLAAPPATWARMEHAAVRLAREVGYANAGTVEYLFTAEGEFAFLELNPRLQVEHPVTEMVTARCDSAEDFSRLNALRFAQPWTGFSFPRIALPFQ